MQEALIEAKRRKSARERKPGDEPGFFWSIDYSFHSLDCHLFTGWRAGYLQFNDRKAPGARRRRLGWFALTKTMRRTLARIAACKAYWSNKKAKQRRDWTMSTNSKGYAGWEEERQERERAEAARREPQKRENEAVRKKRLAGLEARKEAKRQSDNEAIDRQLEPKRQYHCREWLAQHPGKSEADFNKQAWPLLRQNILEDDKRASAEAMKQALRQRGGYGMWKESNISSLEQRIAKLEKMQKNID
jgi:hypothetical protein